MKEVLNMNTVRNNFRWVLKVYIIVSVILVVIAAALTGFTFRNEISFAFRIDQFTERFERNKADPGAPALREITENNRNILNIAVIGPDNSIKAKANNKLLPDGFLQFVRLEKSRWQLEGQPGVSFGALSDGSVRRWLYTMLDLKSGDKWSYHGRNRRGRFEGGFYMFDNMDHYDCLIESNKRGERLFVIFDWQPVAGAKPILMFGAIATLFIIMSGWLLIAFWVYRDASQRRSMGIVWGLAALFTNIFGLIGYLVFRGFHRSCANCLTLQNRNHVFCSYCGNKMADICGNCRQILDGKDLYCPHCGCKLKKDNIGGSE